MAIEHQSSHEQYADLAWRRRDSGDMDNAIFFATMAMYNALLMPEYGLSIGEQTQQLRNNQQGPWSN